MLKNYFTIALRSLRRRKGYAFINIFGLGVGMALCLVMLSFVRHEWGFDAVHDEGVYRVDIRAVTPASGVERKAGQPLPLAPALTDELPEVTAATRIVAGEATVQTDASGSFSERVLFTDGAFFQVFNFAVEAGSDQLRPSTVIVTTSSAQKYFGSADPIGRTLSMSFGGALESFEVIGVAADPPDASTIQFGILVPLDAWRSFGQMESVWTSWVSNTFVRLAEGVAAAAVLDGLGPFTAMHYAPMIRTWEVLQWLKKEEDAFRLELTPMSEIHFRPDVAQVIGDVVNPRYLYVVLALAAAVLLVACINFAALAVSRSTRRVREVGLRKALGAARSQLLKQFWGEALLMSGVSLLVGIVLAETFLPMVNGLLGKAIDIDYLRDPATPAILGALVVATGLIAGAYPAVHLSRFRPVEAFRGGGAGGKNRWIEAMVVVQFACSMFCIAAVLVGSGQLHFMKTKHVGFNEEQVVVVPTRTSDTAESERLLNYFQNELERNNAVLGVTAASSSFNHDLAWNSFNVGEKGYTVYVNRVDPSFVDVLGMRIAGGRGFSEALEGDVVDGVLVNEALVRAFELDDPIGRTLHDIAEIEQPRIVGVVEDYHFRSMHQAIEPAALFTGSSMPFKYLYVRARPGAAADAVGAIESAWQAAAPERPFTYYFLDEDFDRLYRTEDQWQRIVGWAAVLTLLIACMGLFGLAAFATERRTKEIGVRKVLGASVPDVMRLLTMDFIRLVLVAGVVALPAAYVVMSRWLEAYAYRIDPDLTYFAAAGMLGLLIAALTVSVQSARAAVMDPVETLRYD